MRRANGAWMVGIVAMALTVLGCGQAGSTDSATASTSITVTVPADTSSSSSSFPVSTSSSTTTAAPTTVAPTESSPDELMPTFRADGPSGSGCSPGGGDLPDGWWFGERTTPIGGDVGFDLACYYVDAAADAEAAARDDVALGGFYIVNDNPTIRTVTVSPSVTAQCLSIDGVLGDCDVAQVNEGFRSIWIQVVDGEVVRVIEQLLP